MTDSKKVLIVRAPVTEMSPESFQALKAHLEASVVGTEYQVVILPDEATAQLPDTGLTAALAELAHAITRQCEINQAFLELLADQVGVPDGDLPGTLDG